MKKRWLGILMTAVMAASMAAGTFVAQADEAEPLKVALCMSGTAND